MSQAHSSETNLETAKIRPAVTSTAIVAKKCLNFESVADSMV
jgi:hypothetical protein